MDVHEGEESVLVVTDDETFEFRINNGTLNPVSDDIPIDVIELAELKTPYEVNRPDPRTFDGLRVEGPYDRGEGGTVLNYDTGAERYEKLGQFMSYGIDVSIRVYPDGTTELYEIEGQTLENPIRM